MRNRSAIWVFTVLLFLACLYQLSFSWVTGSFESNVNDAAIKKYDSVLLANPNEEIIFKNDINEEKLIIGEATSEKEKQKIIAHYEQEILLKKANSAIYPITGLSYQKCKNQELNLGLDLQGGMSVTLEVSIYDLVKNLSGKSRKPSFKEPYFAALNNYKSNTAYGDAEGNDFIGLFHEHFKVMFPNQKMKYFNVANKEDFPIELDNNQIIQKLRDLSKDAIDKTQRIIESRVNKFGVSQPNIQKQPVSGRLQIELPGAKDKNRIRKLLQSTASLEFWHTNHDDFSDEFLKLNKVFGDKIELEDTNNISEFVELSLDSLSKLTKEDSLAYQNNKLKNDSLIAAKKADKLIKDSLALSSDKILRNSMWFAGTPPVIGYALESDTSTINNFLKSPEAKAIFSSFNRVKFLWNKKSDENNPNKWDGVNLPPSYALMAIEVSDDKKPEIDGEGVRRASQSYNQKGDPVVLLNFKEYASTKWKTMTGKAYDNRTNIAIVLDDIVYSAPGVSTGAISGGNTEISGNFTLEEAQDLANILKAGSLPVPANIIEESIVGPSLGEENINSGLWSFVFAFGLVLFYMIFYYNRAGWVANVALLANIFFILGTLASLGAALTLPGIAGLVLTIGMSVDANVLIYERVKEELSKGKGVKLAIADGYKHAYSAIIDANVTSLLTAVVLAYFGSGPIQGFATTLIIGVFTSLFSALFITRLIFSYMLDNKKEVAFSRKFTKNLFRGTSITFFKKRKLFYVISSLIVLGGLASLFSKGVDWGVEFTGGRTYRVEFSQKIDREEVRKLIASKSVNEDGSLVSPELKTVDNEYNLEITTKYLVNSSADNKNEKVDSTLHESFNDMGYQNKDFSDGEWYEIKSSRSVNPQISDELKQSSLLAIIFSLFIIFIYIAFRFKKWQFGLGALVAMFHDVLVVLGLFSILYNFVPFSMEIDQAFIAAILTVVGYSINDTVVVFDRIREYSILHKKSSTESVIDNALNSTLSRTINTSLSTFLVLLTIFIFGGESIKGFSFALMIGVVVGTYSSLFIATPAVVDLSKKKITA